MSDWNWKVKNTLKLLLILLISWRLNA